jgi:hypothetical protein
MVSSAAPEEAAGAAPDTDGPIDNREPLTVASSVQPGTLRNIEVS